MRWLLREKLLNSMLYLKGSLFPSFLKFLSKLAPSASWLLQNLNNVMPLAKPGPLQAQLTFLYGQKRLPLSLFMKCEATCLSFQKYITFRLMLSRGHLNELSIYTL